MRETFDTIVGGRVTTVDLTLDLIRSGGPITTAELLREIATLRRLNSVDAETSIDVINEALRLHAGAGRIRNTAEGWVYVPQALPAAPVKPPAEKPAEKQRPLFDFSVRGRD